MQGKPSTTELHPAPTLTTHTSSSQPVPSQPCSPLLSVCFSLDKPTPLSRQRRSLLEKDEDTEDNGKAPGSLIVTSQWS